MDVAADLGPPSETGVLNMDHFSVSNDGGSFIIMPDLSSPNLNGSGNIFHLDQVNDLVNNGTVSDISNGIVSAMSGDGGDGGFGGLSDWHDPGSAGGGGGSPSFSFSQWATTAGGTATDTNSSTGTSAAVTGAASTAASVTQEAFTQHIVLGSNIQYNSMPITVVGGDSISGINGDVHTHTSS